MSSSAATSARCPRCTAAFECGAQAGHCACFGIQLTEQLRARLAQTYPGCLCLSCLRELVQADAAGQQVIGAASASG